MSDQMVRFCDPGPRLLNKEWTETEEDWRFANLRWVLKLLDGQVFPLTLGISLISLACGGAHLHRRGNSLEKLIFGTERFSRNSKNTWHIISFEPVDPSDLPAVAPSNPKTLE